MVAWLLVEMEEEDDQISCIIPQVYHLIDKTIFMWLIKIIFEYKNLSLILCDLSVFRRMKIIDCVRCRQFKLRMKLFFDFFFTSFDRVEASDHEYLFFSLIEFFLPIENYEILRRCRFC